MQDNDKKLKTDMSPHECRMQDWGGAVTRIAVYNILCTVQNASKVIFKSDYNANSYYHLRSTSIEFTNVTTRMPDARLGWGSHPNRCLQYPVHSTKCKQGYI
ncbi:hypothetical protein QE152_g39473 [Popillia japonica]|uniref:Uncharacterized protein n=1 Tax=Popillia japonica TaxID=7064 RepID=A0AAW1HTT9_POPJA